MCLRASDSDFATSPRGRRSLQRVFGRPAVADRAVDHHQVQLLARGGHHPRFQIGVDGRHGGGLFRERGGRVVAGVAGGLQLERAAQRVDGRLLALQAGQRLFHADEVGEDPLAARQHQGRQVCPRGR